MDIFDIISHPGWDYDTHEAAENDEVVDKQMRIESLLNASQINTSEAMALSQESEEYVHGVYDTLMRSLREIEDDVSLCAECGLLLTTEWEMKRGLCAQHAMDPPVEFDEP